MILAETDRGLLIFDGNELTIRAKDDDPPKLRLEAPEGAVPTKGVVTFGTRRPDGHFEELVLISGKQDERSRADPYDLTGEVTISVRRADPSKSDDAQFHETLRIRGDEAVSFVPFALSAIVDEVGDGLRSTNGRFRLLLQNDGNLVIYDDLANQPIWSSGSVVV